MLSSFRIRIGNIHRRRFNGISHCENGEQKPQNLLFPLHDMDPHLIQQCLGPPHPRQKIPWYTIVKSTMVFWGGIKHHGITVISCTICRRTTPNRSSDGWGTVAHVRRKVPIGYMARPKFVPKVPLPVDRSPNPSPCLISGPVRFMTPHGIRIRSAVFPQCTGQIDAPTHRPTERPQESLITIARCAPRVTRPNNMVGIRKEINSRKIRYVHDSRSQCCNDDIDVQI